MWNRDEVHGKIDQVKGRAKKAGGVLNNDKSFATKEGSRTPPGRSRAVGTGRRAIGNAIKDLGNKVKRWRNSTIGSVDVPARTDAVGGFPGSSSAIH